MRIFRVARPARHYEFQVYPAENHAHAELGLLIRLIRMLSQRGLPFRVADASDLLLSIGPLTAAQSASFSQQWCTYME